MWVIDKNVDCLRCDEVEAVEYFELLGVRNGDISVVNQRVERVEIVHF